MKISAKAEYACMALLALAQQGADASPLRIREISDTHAIPERYLVQILLQLKGAGLVVSTRGASGGYRLARPAAKIASARCWPRSTARTHPSAVLPERNVRPRVLGVVWDRVRAAERSVLDTTTIAELVAETSPHEWTI